MQQYRKTPAAIEPRYARPRQRFDQEAVLRHRVDIGADGLSVPARDPRQAMRDVFKLDVERRGVEQIEPAARQHPLPGAGSR